MNMGSVNIKEYLIQIANRVTPETTIDDIYQQLSLLADIDESEKQMNSGEVYSQKEVERKAKEWLEKFGLKGL